ncbi:protein translocase subunit SecF [Actinocorallia lasiicapitis]
MSSGMLQRFVKGELSANIVGRPKLWYAISGGLIIFSILGLMIRGLNPGVEFTGGTVFTIESSAASISQAHDVVAPKLPPGDEAIIQETGKNIRITTGSLTNAQQAEVTEALSQELKIPSAEISAQSVGSSWGKDVTQKAWQALIVFMILIVAYLAVVFEWRMAVAAIVALVHDLIITAGIYAWSGFQVTPATLLGFLTILGYSLYDAVVVFDMIKEVTKPLNEKSKITYSTAANQALSSTLVRSLNTSLVAILPVASILFIGTIFLGAGTLKDLSLSLFVGMIVGTYSSICVATPLLVQLKEREPMYKELAANVARRAERKGADDDTEDGAEEEAPSGATAAAVAAPAGKAGPTGPRNQPKRGPRSNRRP